MAHDVSLQRSLECGGSFLGATRTCVRLLPDYASPYRGIAALWFGQKDRRRNPLEPEKPYQSRLHVWLLAHQVGRLFHAALPCVLGPPELLSCTPHQRHPRMSSLWLWFAEQPGTP